MMQALYRFRHLTGLERRVVLEAAAALPVTWIAMRVRGFDICKPALTRSVSSVSSDPGANVAVTLPTAQTIARLQAATARTLFFRTTCLEQSLILCWMLRRRGMTPVLRVGARKEADQFEAHAWVELNGTVLGDNGEQHTHFEPFTNLGNSMEAQPN